jgi:hypothetical protein
VTGKDQEGSGGRGNSHTRNCSNHMKMKNNNIITTDNLNKKKSIVIITCLTNILIISKLLEATFAAEHICLKD